MKHNLLKFSAVAIALALSVGVFSAATAFAENKIAYSAKSNAVKDYLTHEQSSADNFTTFSAKLTQPSQMLKIFITVENQVNADEEIGKLADQALSRNIFKKFFIGPDKAKIKELNMAMDLSRNRIDQLTAITPEIEKNGSTELATEYANLVTVLKNNNTVLQDIITKENKSFSLFGWMIS